MSSFNAGLNEGKKAGQKHGQKAGQKHGSRVADGENKYKEGAKAAAKGAGAGATEGATKGAVKGAGEGVKSGAKVGTKVGASIPYLGAVTGPLGGVIGGAVGGAGGAALGATGGALGGAGTGAAEGAKETERTGNKKKLIGSLKDNIKGALKGNLKDVLILKAKGAIYGVILILFFIALISEGIAEDTSSNATEAVYSVFVDSTEESGNTFNTTGSLILSKDSELQEINKKFVEEMEKTNKDYYNEYTTKYSKELAETVANKVQNITTSYETGETAKLDRVPNIVSKVNGEANLSDERTLFEHILRTEKYNFNNIIWRSYEKAGGGLKSSTMGFQVDNDSKLKYPSNDANDIDNSSHDLNFFVNKTRSYLQSWYIPFDLMVGTEDSQSGSNLNGKFAYEIMAKAYHEIVLDRYKIETLTRGTNYIVYDKTTTTTTTTRTCAQYDIPTGTSIKQKKGDKCTKTDYALGLCKDSTYGKEKTIKCTDSYMGKIPQCTYGKRDTRRNGYANCTKEDYNRGVCIDATYNKNVTIKCNDTYTGKVSECTYGTIKKDVTEKLYGNKVLCTDTTTVGAPRVEKDIRESVKVSKDSENIKYRWDYVISNAKMFDNVISNKYEFKPFYNYTIDNYEKFIAKKDKYKDMTVDEFKESEETNSKADNFSHKPEDYHKDDEVTNKLDPNWNLANVVSKIPADAIKKGNSTTKIIETIDNITKDGKSYEDTYIWNDKLDFVETKSGIYNLDSVKDVTGNDLTAGDLNYYSDIYQKQELNLIDLMNSDKAIYSKYISAEYISDKTENIGIRKDKLDISYNVLKKDLTSLIEKYVMGGLKYGSSLGIDISGGTYLDGAYYGMDITLPPNKVAWPFDSSKYPGLVITSCFGPRTIQGQYSNHTGLDISGHVNGDSRPTIVAAKDGTVVEKHTGCSEPGYYGNTCGGRLGNYVKIKDENGYITAYGHMKEVNSEITVGSKVRMGTPLGIMGTTGSSTGIHLHFAVTYDGKPQNPLLYIEESTMSKGSIGGCKD